MSEPPSLDLPSPAGARVALTMEWRDLLFAHWPVPAAALRPLIPPSLDVDTFDGTAWLGIVPFRMTRVRPLGVPLPRAAFAFAEINVRTYVIHDGVPGVWFFSLDGRSRSGAFAASLAFGLPYRYAPVSLEHEPDGTIRFASRYPSRPVPGAFEASYRGTGPLVAALPGTLEDFLTNRLSLYAQRGDRLLRGDVDHEPWALGPAEAEIRVNSMAPSHGIALPDTPPLLHLAGDLGVVSRWPVQARQV
jgi:uncharacterized protein